MASPIDAEYYQVAAPSSLAERVVISARNRIYADFLGYCNPTPADRILDVGVSDTVTEASNVLERLYPHPQQITAAGLGNGSDFKRAYPKVSYVTIAAGRALPFHDKEFTIACSNAVLEHVGSVEEQRRFVRELLRVSSSVFITVPNRYFPIEHHTGFPFIHYSDLLFRFACRLTGKDAWTHPENLIFMTRRSCEHFAKEASRRIVGYTGFRLGFMSSNIFMYLET